MTSPASKLTFFCVHDAEVLSICAPLRSAFIGGGTCLAPSRSYQQADPHKFPVYPHATAFSCCYDSLCLSIDKRWCVCPCEMFDSHVICGIDSRAFNQVVHHGFLILEGSGCFSTSGRNVFFFCGLQRSGCTRNVCR